jgi:hypothetical protein
VYRVFEALDELGAIVEEARGGSGTDRSFSALEVLAMKNMGWQIALAGLFLGVGAALGQAAAIDSDSDGVADQLERRLGTDPNAAPQNLDLPWDHPDNYWGQFMRRLTAQYAGRIDEWIIWNEPDIWNNQSKMEQWNGSVEQYYQLVKVAYQAAKSANPDCRIILAGLTYWWDQQFGREQYLRRFLNVASNDPTARAKGFYFDVASLHLYGNPRDLYDVPLYFKKVLQQFGLNKPIWITETNVTPGTTPVCG